MSHIQLHPTTSAELGGRWPLGVQVLFTLSALLVIYYLVGTVAFGLRYFYEWNPFTTDVGYAVMVWSVLLSVPVATILAGAGAAIAVGTPRGRPWSLIGVLVAALVAPVIVFIFLRPWTGRWPAVVFGTGGTLIITSVLLTCWFWAKAHARPHPATRRGADLRLLAYVLFGMAAYWT
jgi:hypothetical protein